MQNFLIPAVTSANQTKILDSIYFLNKIGFYILKFWKWFVLKIKRNLSLLFVAELKLNTKQNTAKNSSILMHNLYKEKFIKKKKTKMSKAVKKKKIIMITRF